MNHGESVVGAFALWYTRKRKSGRGSKNWKNEKIWRYLQVPNPYISKVGANYVLQTV